MNQYKVEYRVIQDTSEIVDTESEVIDAAKCLIMNNGALKLVNQQGNLVKAYNKNEWVTVTKVEPEPTTEQLGASFS
jgi:hypothetical protein